MENGYFNCKCRFCILVFGKLVKGKDEKLLRFFFFFKGFRL